MANFLTQFSTEDVEAKPAGQGGDVLKWKTKIEAQSESMFCKVLETLSENGYSQFGVTELEEVKFNPFFKVLSKYLKATKKLPVEGKRGRVVWTRQVRSNS